VAYLSKLSANLSLNISDFRKGLQQGQAEVKSFEKATRRALNSIAGRGGAAGGFTQNERFRQAMMQGRAAGLDSDTLRRARSKQAAFTTGGRLGSAREGLGGLSGGSQMDLSPLFQKATASVQKMNAELASSKSLTSATYRDALRDVKAFEAAVVEAKTKEASMTKANQQLSSLVTSGSDIQRKQDADRKKRAKELWDQFQKDHDDRVRLQEQADAKAKASAASLDKQRSAALYKEFQGSERLQEQADAKAKASAASLDKQRSAALYKEFQDNERLEKQSAEKAKASDNSLAKQREKNVYKDYQDRLRNQEKLNRMRDKEGSKAFESRISNKFSSVATREFLDDKKIASASSKLQAYLGIMGHIGTESSEVNAKFRELVRLNDQAAKNGIQGFRDMATAINKAEKEMNDLLAAEAKVAKVNVGGARGIGKVVAAAGGKGGFGKFGGDASMAFQQAIYAIEDMSSSTDGLRGALRGAANNLTMIGAQFGLVGTAAAVAFTGIAQLVLAFTNAEDIFDAPKKRLEELKKAEEELTAARGRQKNLLDNLIKQMSGQGFTQRRRDLESDRAAGREMAGAAADTLKGLADTEVGAFGDRNAKFGNIESVRNAMASYQIGGATFESDISTMRGRYDLLRGMEGATDAQRASAGWDDATIQSVRDMLQSQQMELLAGALPTINQMGRARAQGQDALSQYSGFAQADAMSASLTGITEVMDDATAALRSGEMVWEDYVAVTEDALKAQNKLNEEIGRYVREQEQQAAFNARRKSALDSYLATTDQGREQAIIDFLQGGQLAGVEVDQLRSEARANFGGTDEDMIREAGAVSKAPIGAGDLRDAAGAAEQTRMLAGQDSAATTRDVNLKQLEAQQRTNDLIDQLISVQPGLAE
jgi:hypothetical protein